MAILSIGIRVTPTIVYYSILEEKADGIEIKQVDKIVNPQSLTIPEQLKFIRNTLCDIINENKITKACIRIAEPSARRVNIPRIYLEGVIQELIASSTIHNYYVGQISSISSRLGIKRAEFKPFAIGEEIYLGIEHWDKWNVEQRESLLSAASALNI